eukprot:PhF_6_TR26073/c0_g1_i1/m.36774
MLQCMKNIAKSWNWRGCGVVLCLGYGSVRETIPINVFVYAVFLDIDVWSQALVAYCADGTKVSVQRLFPQSSVGVVQFPPGTQYRFGCTNGSLNEENVINSGLWYKTVDAYRTSSGKSEIQWVNDTFEVKYVESRSIQQLNPIVSSMSATRFLECIQDICTHYSINAAAKPLSMVEILNAQKMSHTLHNASTIECDIDAWKFPGDSSEWELVRAYLGGFFLQKGYRMHWSMTAAAPVTMPVGWSDYGHIMRRAVTHVSPNTSLHCIGWNTLVGSDSTNRIGSLAVQGKYHDFNAQITSLGVSERRQVALRVAQQDLAKEGEHLSSYLKRFAQSLEVDSFEKLQMYLPQRYKEDCMKLH